MDAGNTDDGSLRRLVDVVPQGCSDEAAGGVVRNGFEYALRVVVQAGWSTIELEQVTGDATVEVPPGGETSFEVRAPDGASAQFGCQVYATSVELAQ